MDYKGKKITVVGLARSGAGAANLLAKTGAFVTVTDKKTPNELSKFIEKLDPSINLALGEHPLEFFENADLIVISPGVPLNIPPLKKAKAKGIRVIGELELAYHMLRQTNTEFFAITGTNGKSTTTTLLYEIIKNSGLKAILGGNIGNALTDEVYKNIAILEHSGQGADAQTSDKVRVIAEVSSFQLETIDKFHPNGAAILNITPDHLDRYSSMSDYIDAKCRIFLNQIANDFLVLNADDPVTDEILKRLKMRSNSVKTSGMPDVFYFSRKNEVKGCFYTDGVIHFNLPEHPSLSSFKLYTSSFKITGVHNIENAMAASLMALLAGSSMEAVAGILRDFPGLEHRLEFVRDIGGVKYINDSKGTNTGAVIKSLESFDVPVILIAGGRDKDSDFSVLKPFISVRVKALILIGEAKEKIKKALGNTTEVFIEDSLKSAVIKAKQIALPKDVVLLSPACASFDMFIDFEDRGRQFKNIVMEL